MKSVVMLLVNIGMGSAGEQALPGSNHGSHRSMGCSPNIALTTLALLGLVL